MAKIFTIEPNPHWVIIDNFSKLPNGAAIYTYRSLNPTQFKPAFQDAGGLIPYGQPIVGFGNGTMPPIFWEFDDAAPEETYYIQVFSAPVEQQGVFLWDFDGLTGGFGGGGGTIVTNNDVENLIINGQFFRHTDNQIGAPSIPTFITLAPSNHAGFVGVPNAPSTAPIAPDIIFAKSNQSDSDSLTFETVAPIGSNNLGLNPTPEVFVRYNCTAPGAAQTFKFIQFPVVKGLQNLSGATVSITMYAKLNSGSTTDVTLSFRQFFGNGAPFSADVITTIGGGPIPLVLGSWTKITLNAQVIPSIAGQNIGTIKNDALFFQINFPLLNAINIDFILPAIYLGSVTSNTDFHTLDEVDAIVNSPRTGDIRTSLNAFAPYGWVNMNDGTIGNAASNATSRKNIDTFPLFDLIWRTFSASATTQLFAPMFTNAVPAVQVPYGASPEADFTANRAISLTRNLGRVMAGALPTQVTTPFTTPIANTLTVASTAAYRATGVPVTVSASTVPQLVNGTTYYARILSATTFSFHTSAEGAINNTGLVTFPANGALGGNIVLAAHALGSFFGEETHLQLGSEVGVHTHGFTTPFSNQANSRGGGAADTVTNAANFNGVTAASAANVPMNVTQPTVFMNIFIKL